MLKFLTLILSLFVVLGSLGCGGGGGGGGNSNNRTAVTFTVDWAGRSRDFSGPSSALSGLLTLTSNSSQEEALSYSFNRQAAPAAYTATYTTEPVRTGLYTLNVQFFTGSAGSGDIVGTASAAVRVLANGAFATPEGQPLGSISTIGRIASVELVAGQTLEVGVTRDLLFTARDAQNNVLAVTQGSAAFSVTSGADRVQVTPSGAATGLLAGEATIEVSVDGVSATGTVTTVPTIRTVNLSVRTLVYDKTRNLLYGSVAGSAATNPNSVVAIDPTTGTVTKAVAVGSEPNRLAISDDDSTLYVSLDGPGAIRRIDLAGFVAGTQFPLSTGSPLFAEDLEVRPGHPDTVAVARYTQGISPRQSGVGIYVDGVLRPNLGGGNVIVFDNTGNTLFSHTNETTEFSLTRSSVDDNGLTALQSRGGLINSFGRNITFGRGRLVTTEFKVIDANNLTLLGEFPNRNFDAIVTPDETNDLVYSLTWDGAVRRFQIFNATNFNRVYALDTPAIGGGIPSLIKINASTFVFNTTEGQIVFVENVPPL